jgi:hypothetical protein
LAAIVGSAALVDNHPAAFFAAINGLAWLPYFLWIAALSVALIRVRDMPTQKDAGDPFWTASSVILLRGH